MTDDSDQGGLRKQKESGRWYRPFSPKAFEEGAHTDA